MRIVTRSGDKPQRGRIIRARVSVEIPGGGEREGFLTPESRDAGPPFRKVFLEVDGAVRVYVPNAPPTEWDVATWELLVELDPAGDQEDGATAEEAEALLACWREGAEKARRTEEFLERQRDAQVAEEARQKEEWAAPAPEKVEEKAEEPTPASATVGVPDELSATNPYKRERQLARRASERYRERFGR